MLGRSAEREVPSRSPPCPCCPQNMLNSVARRLGSSQHGGAGFRNSNVPVTFTASAHHDSYNYGLPRLPLHFSQIFPKKKKNENKKEHRRNINASRDLLQITHATPPKPSEPTSSHRTPPRLCLLLSGTALAPLGQAPDAWPQTCSPFRIRRRLGAIYRSCGCYRSGMSPWTLDHSVKGAAGVCSGIWL